MGAALAAVVALGVAAGVGAQGPVEPIEPEEPATANVEVTVWRGVSNGTLYLSTRPEGGRWRTENTPLDMSARSRSGRFHQSNAIAVAVPLAGGGTANVEVTVWRGISTSTLYLSTRPEGGTWRTEAAALEMSALSGSGRFYQSNAVTVAVPLPESAAPAEPSDGDSSDTGRICRWQDTAAHVVASTVKVSTSTGWGGSAFYVGDGQFVTAGHVVSDRPAWITLRNADVSLSAQLVGFRRFEDGDVALLSASAPGLSPLEWAGTLTIGTDIAIAGYPEALGTSASWTRGTVSRLFTEGGISYIQTDAASSPGNSGGPLVDACGRVAGVVSSSYVGERGSEGLHFAISEPTLGQKLVELGLTGYKIAEGGTVPEGVAEYVAPDVRTFLLSGTVFFDTGEWGGQEYILKVPPEGTAVRAEVGGMECATTATFTRGAWAYYELSVEEGCGGAVRGAEIALYVDGTLARWVNWESGRAEQRLTVLRKIQPTTEEIAEYIEGVLESWGEAVANINAGQFFRCYNWQSGCSVDTNTWAEWMVSRFAERGLRALNNETVEAWRGAALAFWEAVGVVETKQHTDPSAPLDFYREREAAAYAEYLDASCDLWLMQGVDNASEVCAQAGR